MNLGKYICLRNSIIWGIMGVLYIHIFKEFTDKLLKKITRKVEEKGNTLIPINFYLKNGRVKLTLGVCKGKKMFDKRATIKNRDIERDIQREFSKNLRG